MMSGNELFAQKFFARFADGAVEWVGPERLVIGAAIIITGETKTGRRPQNQKRRRKRQPRRPPAGFWTKNGMRRGAEEFRRIKRRQIICAILIEPIVGSLKCRPSRVDQESRKSQKYEQWLRPPSTASHGLTK